MSLLKNIKGDRGIWGVFLLLAIISFLPMYSASSNLANVIGVGSTSGYLLKHTLILLLGFVVLYFMHRIPYRYFSGSSALLLPFVFLLLVYTLSKGTTIAGATASRWIRIPFVGVSFQTSTFAGVVLMIYVARFFSKRKDKVIDFRESFWKLWVPVGLILMTILPANFSTAAILFLSVVVLSMLGGYPIKYVFNIIGIAMVALVLFIFVGRAFSSSLKAKTDTWKNRIVNFQDTNPKDDYQVEKAKIAIATGGMFGRGAGKSVQKNFLPQSSSDFIYAIIVEEYGLLGGIVVILLYMWLLFRMYVVARKATTVFATLLVIGVGFPIILQAIINMAVASNLMPVTGQTLPLLSSGGTSIWMTCFAIGVVLSVSATELDVLDKNIEDESPLDVLYEAVD
ncbi:MAG TPA: cell division protein FtsW [Lutibacter sp.]|nr:cell division protein FtsW [Lutibacter sp.]